MKGEKHKTMEIPNLLSEFDAIFSEHVYKYICLSVCVFEFEYVTQRRKVQKVEAQMKLCNNK